MCFARMMIFFVALWGVSIFSLSASNDTLSQYLCLEEGAEIFRCIALRSSEYEGEYALQPIDRMKGEYFRAHFRYQAQYDGPLQKGVHSCLMSFCSANNMTGMRWLLFMQDLWVNHQVPKPELLKGLGVAMNLFVHCIAEPLYKSALEQDKSQYRPSKRICEIIIGQNWEGILSPAQIQVMPPKDLDKNEFMEFLYTHILDNLSEKEEEDMLPSGCTTMSGTVERSLYVAGYTFSALEVGEAEYLSGLARGGSNVLRVGCAMLMLKDIYTHAEERFEVTSRELEALWDIDSFDPALHDCLRAHLGNEVTDYARYVDWIRVFDPNYVHDLPSPPILLDRAKDVLAMMNDRAKDYPEVYCLPPLQEKHEERLRAHFEYQGKYSGVSRNNLHRCFMSYLAANNLDGMDLLLLLEYATLPVPDMNPDQDCEDVLKAVLDEFCTNPRYVETLMPCKRSPHRPSELTCLMLLQKKISCRLMVMGHDIKPLENFKQEVGRRKGNRDLVPIEMLRHMDRAQGVRGVKQYMLMLYHFATGCKGQLTLSHLENVEAHAVVGLKDARPELQSYLKACIGEYWFNEMQTSPDWVLSDPPIQVHVFPVRQVARGVWSLSVSGRNYLIQ